jgi:hypothetical protein
MPATSAKKAPAKPAKNAAQPTTADIMDKLTLLEKNLKTEINTKVTTLETNLNTKVTTLEKNLKTEMSDLRKNLKTDMARLSKTLGSVASMNAPWLATRVKPFVVSVPDVADAVANGTVATWTWVRAGPRLFAVGCVHCALYYRTVTPGCVFVSLPNAVVTAGVISVHFARPIDALPTARLATADDLVAVEVKANGNTAQIAAVQWPQTAKLPINASGCVFGSSNSSVVSGEGHVISATDGSGVFVETAGEPGQSGTLLFRYDVAKDTPVPLGVYCGVTASANTSMKPRGRMALFPPLGSMTSYNVLPPAANATLAVQDALGVWNLPLMSKNGGVYLNDQSVEYPGVLIAAKSIYTGALDVGACRAR